MLIEGAVLFELHKLYATFPASLNIKYRLPIKVYYRICTLRHIRIETLSHNVVTERYSNSQHELFQQGTTCIPERPQNIRQRIIRARSYQIHVNI